MGATEDTCYDAHPPLLQSEYTSGGEAAGSWESFVAANWLPVLALALGPEWRKDFDGEVAAMVALQLALQPGGGNTTPPAPGPEGPAAALPASPAPAAAAALSSTGAAAAAEAAVAKAYTVEAVDVDGKRRRLRRKRAASPDSPHSSAGDDAGAASEAQGAADSGSKEGSDASLAAPEAGDNGGGSQDAAADASSDGVKQEGGGKPSLVQRVTRQVAKLSIAPPRRITAAPTDSAAPLEAAMPAAAATAEMAAAAEMPTQPLDSDGSSRVAGDGGEGGGSGGDEVPAASPLPQVQRGLLDSLSLVHDLSQVSLCSSHASLGVACLVQHQVTLLDCCFALQALHFRMPVAVPDTHMNTHFAACFPLLPCLAAHCDQPAGGGEGTGADATTTAGAARTNLIWLERQQRRWRQQWWRRQC